MADEYNILDSVGFESVDNDYAVSVAKSHWETVNSSDSDGDGFYSLRSFYINMNGCPAPANIYFVVSVCKQPAVDFPCDYYTSPPF